jgi:hypothetical protein
VLDVFRHGDTRGKGVSGGVEWLREEEKLLFLNLFGGLNIGAGKGYVSHTFKPRLPRRFRGISWHLRKLNRLRKMGRQSLYMFYLAMQN